jgi:uncharacterized protein (DUF2384 family)
MQNQDTTHTEQVAACKEIAKLLHELGASQANQEEWLTSPNMALDMKSPRTMILERRAVEVLLHLEAIKAQRASPSLS